MDTLLAQLSSPSTLLVEHAASVFAVLAHNPSTHFQVHTCTRTARTRTAAAAAT
jgi:hypothetical protein